MTATSYTANWIPVDGEVVDYWVVNRTQYVNGGATTEQLVAEDPMLPITEFCGNESYTVQSVRLGVYSPESNSVTVNSAGITSVENDAKVGFSAYPGGVLVTCSETLANVRVFDPAGRLMAHYDSVENNDIIELPDGIYIITARDVATPIKVIVRGE